MPDCVIMPHVASGRTEFIDHIQSQGFVIDYNTGSGCPQEAQYLITYYDQLQAALQARVHKAHIMNNISTMQEGGHQT